MKAAKGRAEWAGANHLHEEGQETLAAEAEGLETMLAKLEATGGTLKQVRS